MLSHSMRRPCAKLPGHVEPVSCQASGSTRVILRLLAWMLALAVLASARPAGAVSVRVRGGATLDLIATQGASEVTLRGQIADDVGASLGKATVRIEAVDTDGRVVHLPPAASCRPDDVGLVRNDGDAYVVTTNERGDFCVKKPGSAEGLVFRARFVGNNFFDEAETKANAAQIGRAHV